MGTVSIQKLKLFRSRLDQAIAFRQEQRLEKTRDLILKARSQIRCDDLVHARPDEFEAFTDLLLLESSLDRADRQLDRAQEKLAQVEAAYLHRGLKPSYTYYLQKGLTAISQSTYPVALEHFLAARSYARDPQETFWALGNALLCIEDLGLPYENTLQELKKISRKLKLGDASHSQMTCLEARQEFRSGNLSFVKKANSLKTVQQIHFYKLWVQMLPFVDALPNSVDSRLEDFAMRGRELYLYSYRLRTLRGEWSSADQTMDRWSEIANRFYLWTWRWLVHPETFDFSKLEPLLKQIANAGPLYGKLSSEDYQMIRNALGWISLFEASQTPGLQNWLRAHRPNDNPDFPIYAFEHLIQKCFQEMKHGKTTFISHVESHFLSQNSQIQWAKLFKSVKNRESAPLIFKKLIDALIEITHAPHLRSPSDFLQIDLTTHEIQGLGLKKPIISIPMARALNELSFRGTIALSDFVRICFDLPRYDASIHDLKVMNLLARIRTVLPVGASVGIKGDFVRSSGLEPHLISFKQRNVHTEALHQSSIWKSFLTEPAKLSARLEASQQLATPSLLIKNFSSGAMVTRHTLEQLTQKSRATTNRWITAWIKQGYLIPAGAARRTRYRIILKGQRS
jgi:hypothetical protein